MDLLVEVLKVVDPRLQAAFTAEVGVRAPPLRWKGRCVLVGHRAAGKSRLLPMLAARLNLPAVDLDALLEQSHGATLRDWYADDAAGFRAAEAGAFCAVRGPAVVAVGGGFLSNHAELLADDTPVLVPISFPTYRARLLADHTRPRLRPDLPLETELKEVFDAREAQHRRVPTVPLSAVVRELLDDTEKEALSCSAS